MTKKTIKVDVVALVKVPHNIPIINMPHPAVNVELTEEKLIQLLQFPQYTITKTGTNEVITGKDINSCFKYTYEEIVQRQNELEAAILDLAEKINEVKKP